MYTLLAVYVHYFNRSIDLTINFHTNTVQILITWLPVGSCEYGRPVLKQICNFNLQRIN